MPAGPHAERLAWLRQELRRRGCDGFWLRRTDPHGSEYLPPHEERVAWLTGFTGSAALVVVLADRAAIFVDGRYTLQVREEVDPALFEPLHVIDDRPHEWAARHLPPGGHLGFNPFLLARPQLERLEKALRRRRAQAMALVPDPVDAIWRDRPAPPVEPVELWDVAFAGESSLDKRRRMGGLVADRGAEWLLVTACDSIAWLLNVRGRDIPYNPLVLSYALLHRDGRCLWFVDRRKLREMAFAEEGVELRDYAELLPALDALGRQASRVLVDPARVHVGFADRLQAAGADVIEGEDPIPLAKAKKNPTEIEGARRAHLRDGVAMARFLYWLSKIPLDGSVGERDVARRITEERGRDPFFRGPSFETIAAFGPSGAIVHYRVDARSERRLHGGSLLLVDSGGHYLDGTTDITRTVALGEPDEEMCRRFTQVLEGHVAVATVRFPAGTAGGQLDALARLPLWASGLDYDHGTGHGVGAYLCVHEGPQRIAKRDAGTPLEPGMILSNEPGYYRPGAWGIRTENLVLVRELPAPPAAERRLLGFETLTLAPIDRRLVLRDELSPAARAWLDAYHAHVYETLAPQLEPPVRAWLEAVCRPL